MSEETNVNEGTPIPGEPDPVVEKATAQGWVDKETWVANGNPPEEWRDAQTFIDRGELFSKIAKQNRELQRLREDYQQLAEHHAKVREMERAKALEELKRAKAAAMENGDFEVVADVDEKILDLKTQELNEQNSNTVSESPEFVRFKESNPWYGEDPELTEEADIIGIGYATRTGKSEAEVLEYVQNKIKNMYPEKFGLPKRAGQQTTPSSSTTSTKSSGGAKKFTEKDLSMEQRMIAKRFVEAGALDSVQEYVDQLVELGELG